MRSLIFFIGMTFWNVSAIFSQPIILAEAEHFSTKGGWVVDQQFMDEMGSPYLMAHGMGIPVANARSVLAVHPGEYYLWVRTKDWAPYPKGPGSFRILIDSIPCDTLFGSSGLPGWQWYRGCKVRAIRDSIVIELADQTGFNGRCDALVLSANASFVPPSGRQELDSFRRIALQLPALPPDAGSYDLVVAGGGIAGICAAIEAARLGMKVALINNRPVPGGNNSSEIRVHLMGEINKNKYPKLGRIVRELDNGDPGNAGPAREYGDSRKIDIIKSEKKNILFFQYALLCSRNN